MIPDDLYARAKALASRYECSFADLVRQGLEYVTDVNRHVLKSEEDEWAFPVLTGGNQQVSQDDVQKALAEMRDGA